MALIARATTLRVATPIPFEVISARSEGTQGGVRANRIADAIGAY